MAVSHADDAQVLEQGANNVIDAAQKAADEASPETQWWVFWAATT